jgi:regulator of sigma E protease
VEVGDGVAFNEKHPGESVVVEVRRDGEVFERGVELNADGSEYLLGVSMQQEGGVVYRYTWSAPIVGVGTMVQLTGETFRGLGEMVWGFLSGVVRQVSFDPAVREDGARDIEKVGDGVAGPVGIVGVIFPAFLESGFTNLMFLVGVISISLACMNVLPIPALDGGRWLLILIYKLRRKKLTREVEGRIVGRAFMVLIGLVILVTVLDLTRIFK